MGATHEHAGRVVAVYPAIGMIDIEFSNGNKRYPVEDVQRLSSNISVETPLTDSTPGGAGTYGVSQGPSQEALAKRASRLANLWLKQADDVDPDAEDNSPETESPEESTDNTESPADETPPDASEEDDSEADSAETETESASEEPSKDETAFKMTPDKLRQLADVLEKLQSMTTETQDSGSDEKDQDEGSEESDSEDSESEDSKDTSEGQEKQASLQKTAIYWSGVDRQYRATQEELDTKKYLCPRCKIELQRAVYRREGGRSDKLFGCKSCLFLVLRDSLQNCHLNDSPEPNTPDCVDVPMEVPALTPTDEAL